MVMSSLIVNTARSFRAALEMPKKFQLIGYLENRNNNVSPLKEALKELANSEMNSEEIDGVAPMAVLGHNCTLCVKIEPSQCKDMAELLQKQLDKLIQRRQQMADVLQNHKKLLNNLKAEPQRRSQNLKKAERKVKPAEKYLEFTSPEIERFEEVL